MSFVLATENLHKRDEIAAILARLGVKGVPICTLRDVPSLSSPVEDGATFAENARIKAFHVSKTTGGYALADDSGLCVDALNGAPGIHSSRYAGENATDADRIAKLLRELRDVPDEKRRARFVCAMALTHGHEIIAETEGVCEGRIALNPAGSDGFGYDPVFYLPDRARTLAEVGPEEKNRISHRFKALNAIAPTLARVLVSIR
ncbi:MAG: RdgB/HAM1 family non-canonical purine NTP pyrophosphatase [Candidatus Poribacteria bacterium]|nr:RdgB/HAM1 family non-canonical purine NTP pyrophosphatase [Candidatus Poribacteria bacterium]